MNELIGISVSHEEQISPAEDQFSIFFEILRVFDWRTEPINGHFSSTNLMKFKNIIIGEPHREFALDEISALQSWVLGGGNLLLMASCSGDTAPSGNAQSHSNISELLEGIVRLPDNSLGIDRGIRAGKPFDTKVMVDISHLVGIQARLCYDTGCTLVLTHGNSIVPEYKINAPADSSIVTGVRMAGDHVSSKNPYPQQTHDPILLIYRKGEGRISIIGSSWAFKDDTIIRESNVLFTNWLLAKTFNSIIENYINDHEDKPQRHRLLHGYPFPNLMHKLHSEEKLNELTDGLFVKQDRPFIIGILPHTFCNPMVKGCGFCTFPHEQYSKSNINETVDNVSKEMETFNSRYGAYFKSEVKSIYFGGGTANLTPMDKFEKLCRTLSKTYQCSEAEVTLEGVPKYFSLENYRYLDILLSYFKTEKLRLSIGIQTFNEDMIVKMGRQNFGDKNCIKSLADDSRKRNIGISGDLLFNLPGQSIEMMKSDVNELINIGFNQISIYHLVMFRALGPEWSKDRDILSALPDNKTSLSNWMALRDLLLSNGYEQRTLTNFQKINDRSFEYEECVFSPESFNWVGFGPSAISVFYDDNFDRGLKFINPETAEEYNSNQNNYSWHKYFAFDKLDMKILFITRKIALLSINKVLYKKLFGTDIETDFREEIYSLTEKQFIKNDEDSITLTPEGMFYADTVAGLFALRKVKYNRMLMLVRGKIPEPERYLYAYNYHSSQFSYEYNSSLENRMG